MKTIAKNIGETTNFQVDTQPEKLWLDSVSQFKELIESDPVLRMNWQHGISLSTNLKDKTVDEVYSMIDKAIRQPPSYKNCIFLGLPLNFVVMDFMQNQNGRAFFTNDKVNSALKKIFSDYAKMLESPKSTKYLNDKEGTGWFSKEADKRVNNWQFKCNPELEHFGYKCWNDWFIREFKEGMRPVGDGAPIQVEASNMIVNACESVPIDDPEQPQRDCKLTDKFWLKSNRYSLTDIFGGKKHNKEHVAKHFEGGTVYQAYLSALSYHRWHAPVDGIIEDIYQIDANYYFDQSQFIDYDPLSQTKCQSFLTAMSTRKIFIIKSDNEKIGKVAIVCVGMAEVSCCVSTVNVGSRVKKGDQLGFFKFGGSSHALIFEKNANIKFKIEGQSSDNAKFTLQKVNSYLGHVE